MSLRDTIELAILAEEAEQRVAYEKLRRIVQMGCPRENQLRAFEEASSRLGNCRFRIWMYKALLANDAEILFRGKKVHWENTRCNGGVLIKTGKASLVNCKRCLKQMESE